MIKVVTHDKIDFKKYDACIALSEKPLVYAYSWYLDAVTQKDWEVWVWGDYQAVMPITYMRLKRNLFLRKIVQPDFAQQLGVFGKYDEIIFTMFLKKLKQKKGQLYSFHNEQCKGGIFEQRNNFVLPLGTDYFKLHKKYSTNLRRNLKKAEKVALQYKISEDIEEFSLFFQKNNPAPWTATKEKKARQLMAEAVERGNGQICQAVSKKGQVLAQVFWVKNSYHSVYLFSASTQEGKLSGAIAFILDQMIRQKPSKNIDFEGSQHVGIARFFKSFGAQQQDYFIYKAACFSKFLR